MDHFLSGKWLKLKERRKRLIKRHGRYGLLLKRFSVFFFVIPLVFEVIMFIAGLLTPNSGETVNFKDPIWIYWTLIGVGIYLSISLIFTIILLLITIGEDNYKHRLVETNETED